jgi:hypothetical protein
MAEISGFWASSNVSIHERVSALLFAQGERKRQSQNHLGGLKAFDPAGCVSLENSKAILGAWTGRLQ